MNVDNQSYCKKEVERILKTHIKEKGMCCTAAEKL